MLFECENKMIDDISGPGKFKHTESQRRHAVINVTIIRDLRLGGQESRRESEREHEHTAFTKRNF